MKLIGAIAVSVALLMGQSERPGNIAVTAVRHWSLNDITRIAVEVSGEFQYRTDRLHNPERVYFDILNARPRLNGKALYSQAIDDKMARRVRVAETASGITRVVVDLAGSAEVSSNQLTNPDRLIIELRPASASPVSSAPPAAPNPPAAPPLTNRTVKAVLEPGPAPAPPRAAEPNKDQLAENSGSKDVPAPSEPPPSEAARAERKAPAPVTPAETGKAARHTSRGDSSLTRALGLKINKVVIDPGHGGHDEGTRGPKGYTEKELVLDVAKRVGKLVEQQMGAEVILTRSDDTFIPLEGRTALANEQKADLFLSIHANSSPSSKITGVEVYYLNFPDTKEAMDVAARENASSQKSVYELRDIIQKITLHDKAEESREFASKIQSSLYTFSSRSFPGNKNRGVKKAPFVVLIGATMPSVLAEIGFLSNPREEQLLKRADYRQKLAEALFHGITRYAEGLSHFQVAQQTQPAQ